LHERIRVDIEQQILSGAWPPGTRVPVEHELMEQYGCSRMTVNKAVSALAAAGLIVRRRRAGSFVSRPRLHSVVLDIPDIQAQIAARGQPYSYRLLSRKRRAAYRKDAQEMQLANGAPLLALRCLHIASDQPFALEDRLISLSAVPEAEGIDFAEVAPGAWLLGHVPWTEARHRICAINADKETARLLDLAVSAACLSVERETWRGKERITYVRQLFPGDAYDLVARFAPAQA
jgi:GntR family histidine utilization transcriptional repressor